MDSVLSVPVFYLFLIFTQIIYADSSSGGGKADESNMVMVSPHDENANVNRGTAQQQAILRLLLLAAQNNNRGNTLQFRPNNWGIPFRPVRRIGSEFLGKRSDIPAYEEDGIEKRARMGSEFLGKRRMGSEFLGKRAMGSEFLGKRRMGSEFLGKRAMGSEFLGKRRMGSEFLGKRGMGSEFLGKRGMGSEFLGKRGMGSEFLGKRGMGSEFLGKRRMGSEFLGKRTGSGFPGDYEPDLEQHPLFDPNNYSDEHSTSPDNMYNYLVEKRAMGSEFLGKRKPDDYSWKRGRLGSEFLGKRAIAQELPQPFLQATGQFDVSSGSESNSTEEH